MHSSEIEQLIDKLKLNIDKINSLRPLSADIVKYFYDNFVIDLSYNSNSIEGNTFTYDETKLLIKEGIVSPTRSLTENNEIVGVKDAFYLILNQYKNKDCIDKDFIVSLNQIVMRGSEIPFSNDYRKIRVFIGDSSGYVRFEPTNYLDVPQEMKELIDSINDNLDNSKNLDLCALLEQLIEHHVLFESIHPFIDGNGRTGRLLLNFELLKLGLPLIDIKKEDREHYYAGLSHYKKKEDHSTNKSSKYSKLMLIFINSMINFSNKWLSVFDYYKE